MSTNYNEIRKIFNYYIREYYYQKSKGTYFVNIKKPGILFTSLKFYKKKKTFFPNIYDWYFDSLSDLKKNKDILNYPNDYDTKNIFSYKIRKGTQTSAKNDVDSGNVYINGNEECLENTYKTSNLYYNMNPVYLSKICLYNLNDYHILYSNNYYDSFMQFYYSIISYKMDINNLKIFPNLKILISHIKNLSSIINDELIKNSFFYFIRQKKVFDEQYLLNIFSSLYAVMLHNSPFYLFLDDFNQLKVVLNLMDSGGEVRNMFESVIPYPYYLVLDDNINIYNLQSFNIYLKKILDKKMETSFYADESGYISSSPGMSSCQNVRISYRHCDGFKKGNSPNGNSSTNDGAGRNVHRNDKLKWDGEEKLQSVENEKNIKIYFFKLIKIFDMKPNHRFVQKSGKM
ncbi:hypothetical protein, conserved [Plasmodium gonderi]|uniref:Uncharacterized protein n=1 Tax=Plasmodium gonderi TaxID=77519 RepID=A0A1Y1JEZ1_PLAGO|nr:hypothetical protein, conserved [Plasmodium gonderi]GAW81101.1 hypothetical protein, conserved [Plasmodium gonderi]